jgi:hypothetical protein
MSGESLAINSRVRWPELVFDLNTRVSMVRREL